MSELRNIIAQVERYADAQGISPEHVCRRATNNPRLLNRLKRRDEQTQTDISRILQFMKDNPPKQSPSNGGL